MTYQRQRSVVAALLFAISVVFALVLAPTPASATPAGRAAAAAPYPPVFCPTLSVSTTHPFPGQQITITGEGFDGVQSLTIVMTPGSHVLAHVTTSAAGTFSTHATLPAGVTGSSVIRADGSGSDCPVTPINIQVSGSTHTPQSPLGSTGVDILTGVVIALALIALGVALSRGGRRRYHGIHTHV